VETSLHRDLKAFYAGDGAQFEVPLAGYRVDVIHAGRLIEIQHGKLAAIRDKVRALLESHDVLVVKPIIVAKHLLKRPQKDGPVLQRRRSPLRGSVLDVFLELVHFTNVFPHPRLTLDVALVAVEEDRYPGHGRRRRWRRNDFQVADQRLVEVREVHRFSTAAELAALIDCRLPQPFHTQHLAEGLSLPRWKAQQIAYCLAKMGGLAQTGKTGNTRLYTFAQPRPRRRSRKSREAG